MAPQTVTPGALTLCCSGMDARPLFGTDPDGSRHGYEPAVAGLAAAELGLELVWALRQWSAFVPTLDAGECDAVWCGQAITPARRERVDFSRPYAVFDESVLVRAGDAGIGGPADLAGRRVGAIAGSTNLALAETFAGVRTVPFDGASDDVLGDMIGALRAGSLDAIVDDDVALIPLAEDPGLHLAFTVPTRQAWGAAVRKGEGELLAAIDAALAALEADGRLAASWREWLPELRCPFTG